MSIKPETVALPVRMEPSEQPWIMDSLTENLRAINEGRGVIQPEMLDIMIQFSQIWGRFLTEHRDEIRNKGVLHAKIQSDSMPYDCVPGSNRVSLFDDFRTRAYNEDLLDEFDSPVRYLDGGMVSAIISGRADIETPFVLKDMTEHKGRGKLLIQDEEAKKRMLRFLRIKRKDDVARFEVERFVETPSDANTSYRITATPGGFIHGATLLYTEAGSDTQAATTRDSGSFLAPLVNPKGKYFLGSPRIASNIDSSRRHIGLRPPQGETYDLAPLTDRDAEILELHGIDPETREMSIGLCAGAISVARIIGASVGVHTGIDLIQDQDTGTLHLLEVNGTPEYTSLRDSALNSEDIPSDIDLRRLAFLQTIDDLGSGVFANNPFTK